MSEPELGRPHEGSRRVVALASLALFAATCAVYIQVLGHGFVSFDDPNYITSNAVVQRGLTLEGLGWAFSSEQAANWHPLTWLSHMLDCSLFGMDAGWHHAMSVLMHALSACFLFLALRMLTGRLWPSLLVAALFALHPLHVESVAWASERKDVLSGLFWMTTLLAYGWYVRTPSAIRYGLVAVSFALGLLSKPMLVTLPCVLLLLDYWPLSRGSLGIGKLVAEKLPLFALSAVSVFMTLAAQSSGGSVRALSSLTLETRLSMVPRAYGFYLSKTLWPSELAIFYPHPAIGTGQALHFTDGATLVTLGVLILLTVLTWRLRKRAAYGLVGWLWFLGTLVPVIGIVQVGDQAVADRYTYLPLIGLTIPIVWGLADAVRARAGRGKLMVGAALALLLACSAVTWVQLKTWKDSLTLFEHALEVTEGNYLAHTMVGFERTKLGERLRAEEHFESALVARPNYASALFGLGQSLLGRDVLDRAQAALEQAVRFAPQRSDARVSLSVVYLRQKNSSSAGRVLGELLRMEPSNVMALSNLGALEELRDDDTAAARAYLDAMAIDASYLPPRMSLAALHRRRGEHAAALQVYRDVLALEPENIQALCGVAWILATATDRSLRDPVEALRLAQGATRRTARGQFELLVTLAAAQAAAGNFPQAVRAQEAALSQAPKARREELEAHLEEYRAGRALFL